MNKDMFLKMYKGASKVSPNLSVLNYIKTSLETECKPLICEEDICGMLKFLLENRDKANFDTLCIITEYFEKIYGINCLELIEGGVCVV